MSPPVRPEPDPMLRLRYFKETGQSEQAAQYEKYLRETNQWRDSGPSPRMREVGAAIRRDINERESRTPETRLNAGLQAFSDASTFGVAGLVDDFVSGIGTPGGFRANRDFRDASRDQLSGTEAAVIGIAGGLANPVGAFLGPAKVGAGLARAGLLRTMGKGAVEGALQGGAQMFGENVGTTRGAVDETLFGAAMGAPFGAAGAGIARSIAGRAGGALPSEITASGRAARANEADRAMRYEVPAVPQGPGMPPPMDLDVLGPNAMAQAARAGHSVEGDIAARPAFEQRASQMVDAITHDAPDAIAEGNRLRAVRRAQADIDFPAAEAATKGKAKDSPFLRAFRDTEAGGVVWNKIMRARPARVLAAGDPARALPSNAAGDTVPDAEAIHEMTRWLRKRSKAKGGSFPDGIDADDAVTALELLEQTKNKLPKAYRTAIDNYARLSEPIEALELGMRRFELNPVSRKAAPRAVENVRNAMATMSPEALAALRLGKHFDIASRVRKGTLTPESAVAATTRAGDPTAFELSLLGPQVQSRFPAWENALRRQGKTIGATQPMPPQDAPGLLGAVLRGTSMMGKEATAWRILRGALSDAGAAQVGKEQAAYINLITKQGNWDRTLAALSAKDQAVVRAAQQAAARSGRQGGLLFPE